MKTFKKIVLGLLIFIIVLIGIAFILPSHVHVERSLIVKAAPDIVYTQINTLKNWEKWSPWHQIDPQMKLTYTVVS